MAINSFDGLKLSHRAQPRHHRITPLVGHAEGPAEESTAVSTAGSGVTATALGAPRRALINMAKDFLPTNMAISGRVDLVGGSLKIAQRAF